MSDVSINNTTLELAEYNPYRNGDILVFEDGQQELRRKVVDYEGNEDDEYYTVKTDDTLDRIAWIKWADKKENPSKYWHVIADANVDLIDNPLDISNLVGQEILIPDIVLFELQAEAQE